MENRSEIPYFFNKEKSGFNEEEFELISPERFHFDDERLSDNLRNNFFEYKTHTKNNIAFYFINYLIESEKDLKDIHIRIFNEDKVDFYIIKRMREGNYSYNIISAKTTHDNIQIIIEIPSEDEELLQTINKTSIDTGAFWIYYKDVLKNIRTTNVRIELVKVLSDLRNKLKSKIRDDIHVQALIDRTLFIKFLEDRHIINSYFYGNDIEYKEILKTKDPKKVNELFRKVHKIFNNYLFKEPTIPEEILTNEVLQIVQNSIEGVKNGQLTLFDLKFDIIPIEAISQIYEIFFDDEQRAKGIYYTPKTLTDFIVNLTIDKKGTIIDPACGSGAFLISAYKKLLKFTKNNPVKVHEKIDLRVDLIKEHIFGIEKEEKARRLTIFALYLSILEDLTVDENKELKEFLKQNKDYSLFKKNIGENIERANTFEPNKFDNTKFEFIIGNPPWKKDFKDDRAEKYYDANKDFFSGKTEISQLFQHKAKTWENENTRYGFVVNTSNFTNEYSRFQDFFYKNFTIEKFYEVSNLDFFTASEPAIVCIYTRKHNTSNTLVLNVLKANEFSKLFKTVLIIEQDSMSIKQDSLIKSENHENIPLRNFLVGSDGDFKIINYLESRRFEKFENYILRDESGKCFLHQGVKVYAKEVIPKVYGVDLETLLDKDLIYYETKFKHDYTSISKTEKFQYSYIKPNNISRFVINDRNANLYLPSDISIMHRPRVPEINEGDRIILPNHGGSFKAVYVNTFFKFYPSADLNILKLNNNYYYFYTALLNSTLVEYYLKVKFWNRLAKGHSRINQDPILHIPIPVNKNTELIEKITVLSKQLTNKEVKFEDKEEELNNLIYKLYGIGIIEKQRINDFFIKDKEPVKKQDIVNYANEFSEYFSEFLNPEVKIVLDIFEEKNLVKGITIVKIYFGNKGEEYPKSQKVGRALLFDLLKNTNQDNILTLRKRLYAENTIYIIKDNFKKSWSLTRANEDAIAELNKIFKHKSKKN